MNSNKNNTPRLAALEVTEGKMIFRNFSGTKNPYNTEGDRTFCLVLEDEKLIKQLTEDGWNVKTRPARAEDEEPTHYTEIRVSYDRWPPQIFIVDTETKNLTPLDETSVGLLDNETIASFDCVINPSRWSFGGKSGVKGYLQKMFVILSQDSISKRYSDYGNRR